MSHVVEPVERGLAKINTKFQQISDNVKRYEELRRNAKDDNHVIPMNSWTREFPEVQESLGEGSMSDSGLINGKRPPSKSKGWRFMLGK